MITRFLDPYSDEMFYSVCARFSDRAEYHSQRSIVQDLFGTGHAIAAVGLPSHLSCLVAAMPPGHRYGVDQLIDEHTFLLPKGQMQNQLTHLGRLSLGVEMVYGFALGDYSSRLLLRIESTD